MAEEEEKRSHGILQLISNDQQELKHKAFRTTTYNENLPLYKLRREPTHIKELDGVKDAVIWCDNETLICLNQSSWLNFEGRHIRSTIYEKDVAVTRCVIYGKTDAAIAESATLYWSLKYHENTKSRLHIRFYEDDDFDFSAFQPEQLACIFDANPERHFEFSEEMIFTAEQFAILATRPYPLNIELSCIHVKDEGTAFVEALEKRQQPSFGSFIVIFLDKNEVPFSSANLKRLFSLDITFEKLKIGVLNEACLLPLSMKTDTLDYEIEAKHLRQTDVEALDIMAKDLTITIYLNDMDEWYEPLISVLNRIAELGHFERLSFSVDDWMTAYVERSDDNEDRVAEALIKVIKSNPKLEYLDISNAPPCFDWSVNFDKIFEAMEDHTSLRTFILQDLVAPLFYMSDRKFERECLRHPVNDWLAKLISRNRNIIVYDKLHERCSKQPRIHKIYALNAFFNGSAELVKESSPDRPLLAATALVEGTAENFQYSALLLSDHTDMLCELIQDINLEEMVPEDIVLPVSIPTIATKTSKRKTKRQLSRVTKKAAHV